ncbi:DUF2528 family protein [Cyclobacterium sp.]|uniref:DUF2528 family protein n=1 Tax=Cyclobacterium sp. TaxID=1966343 RepID=UPI0019BC1F91|nr:DUF2528 family protein [Cyclobacterium sp.]MBD3627643.1 DUF2528 family protein [Cyclobacterium sp.]
MAKKRYDFNYDFHKAEVSFEVDLEKFTPEMANETLTFFTWDYDEEADPIDEVMKKYAMAVLRHAMEINFHSVENVKDSFSEEGFGPIDGSIGITLIKSEPFELDEDDLEMEVKDV